ncbi:lantibiotic dehydratase [Mucilaginibacter sp. CSA2-8R]|uniref:lantibiotic dehydratase n=1 Tax=Mucilaginibacter sp. CSA2-8R TaxID=3141542 RepID=UPI00315C5CC0
MPNHYQFHDTVVLRHPVYSFQQFDKNNLAAKLQDSFFRDAIYLCSPTVFDELKKCSFDYTKLNAKLKNTVLKYFNRMCYRPTPFALCAAVSTVKWTGYADEIQVDELNFKPHVKLSYAKSLQVAAEILETVRPMLYVRANATLYKVGKQYRYIKSMQDDTDKITFYIASADATSLLSKVLKFGSRQRVAEDITAFIIQKTNCKATEAAEYLQSLLEEQILVDAHALNITGKDYLQKLSSLKLLNGIDNGNGLYQNLNHVDNALTLSNYLGHYKSRLQKNDLYINLESISQNGAISSVHQKAILDGLHCLTQLNQPQAPKGMSLFLQQFNKKFEGQTIPLLQALDPEVGVGYSDLTSGSESLNFADGIGWGMVSTSADTVKWGQLQSLILKKWMAGGKYQPVILCAEDVNIAAPPEGNNLPSTLSVMFRPAGEKIFIEQVAGITATSLIGRFTPVSDEIDALAQHIASHEANSNPGVIYAEIVHVCHKQTANIDRRNHIYPYEIVMLTPSVTEEDYQIPLSDLWVSVQNNEVIMWSAKHGKRVIPRLSSAFNYQRDDLAAFRFLCDLQHVGVQTNFNFAIENVYLGLDFYPRVEFEQAILQCAQWHPDISVFTPIINEKNEQKRLEAFSQLRHQLQFCKYVALTQHDHQLVFNLDNPADVDFFMETVQPLKKIVIREVLAKSIDNPTLFNKNKEGVASQFIATVYHNRVVYQPKPLILTAFKKQVVRRFSPGTEWLYLKLYSHQARTNEIIGTAICQAVRLALKADLIKQWFFTRYNDPEHHIRLRLKVRQGKHQNVISIFNQETGDYHQQGLLSNIIIDTYHRELERYPNIDAFENIFFNSSDWVCRYFNSIWQQLNQEDCLSFAFLTTRSLLQAAGFSSRERMNYLTGVVDSFFNEFSHVPGLKYQLDLTYRKYKGVVTNFQDSRSFYAQYKLVEIAEKNSENLTTYFGQIKAIQLKFKHLADIIHMHLNRIFADQPREQECTLYYLLLKYEKSSRYISQAV